MGGAPVIETVRAGVRLEPGAAASFRRLEARAGRLLDVNRTYAEYGTQLRMYNAWQAYVQGRGPHPGHSRALHPDESMHCRGLAWDTDDWTVPGFIALAGEHGWIRTAAWDPTEQHHFEYQSWRDRFFGQVASVNAKPFTEEDELMGAKEDIIAHLDRKVAELDTRRDTAIVWVNGSAYVVDHGAGTKWNVARGQGTIEEAFAFIQFLKNLGITEYQNQAPFVLAGYRDVTEEGSVREEVAKALRDAAPGGS